MLSSRKKNKVAPDPQSQSRTSDKPYDLHTISADIFDLGIQLNNNIQFLILYIKELDINYLKQCFIGDYINHIIDIDNKIIQLFFTITPLLKSGTIGTNYEYMSIINHLFNFLTIVNINFYKLYIKNPANKELIRILLYGAKILTLINAFNNAINFHIANTSVIISGNIHIKFIERTDVDTINQWLTELCSSYHDKIIDESRKHSDITKVNISTYMTNIHLLPEIVGQEGGANKYKKTENKITVIYKKKEYTRVIYICERKKYIKLNKTYMLLSKLKKV